MERSFVSSRLLTSDQARVQLPGVSKPQGRPVADPLGALKGGDVACILRSSISTRACGGARVIGYPLGGVSGK